MGTSPKRAAKPPERRKRSGPTAKRAAGSKRLSAQSSLRFHIPAALGAKTLAVLTALEQSDDPRAHRHGLAELVVALNEAGSRYYFLRPLKLAKAGFTQEQVVNLSLAANQRIVASAIRSVIGRMDDKLLLFVSAYIRQLML